jgi:hypothetical protein
MVVGQSVFGIAIGVHAYDPTIDQLRAEWPDGSVIEDAVVNDSLLLSLSPIADRILSPNLGRGGA